MAIAAVYPIILYEEAKKKWEVPFSINPRISTGLEKEI